MTFCLSLWGFLTDFRPKTAEQVNPEHQDKLPKTFPEEGQN